MSIASVGIVGQTPTQGPMYKTDEAGIISGPDTRQAIFFGPPIDKGETDPQDTDNPTLIKAGTPLVLDKTTDTAWRLKVHDGTTTSSIYAFLLQSVDMRGPGGTTIDKDPLGGILYAGDVNAQALYDTTTGKRGLADAWDAVIKLSPKFTFTGYQETA